MKIALITDTHAGCRSDSPVFNDYILDYWCKTFIPYIIENQIDTVIHLGDVFDRRKYVNFGILNSWRKNVFEVLESKHINMHYIIGNHDCFLKNTNDINSVTELLSEYSNTTIYTEAEEVSFGGTDILFVPWINEFNKEQALNKIAESKSQYCMGHFELIGFEMFRGAINQDKGLSKDVLSKFTRVFSGHFHHRSIVDNIHYLGSPYETSWADYNDPRGFHIFDTASGNTEFIQNTCPMFQKIFYQDSGLSFEQIIQTSQLDSITGKYVKLVVKEKTNFYIFDQFLEEVQKRNPADLTIVESFIEDELTSEENPDTIDQTKDTMGILADYIGELNIAENSENVLTMLRNIYTEALTRETVAE